MLTADVPKKLDITPHVQAHEDTLPGFHPMLIANLVRVIYERRNMRCRSRFEQKAVCDLGALTSRK